MSKFLVKTSEGDLLCFNHAIIAAAAGVPLEIVDVSGFMPAMCCKWCKFEIPQEIQDAVKSSTKWPL